MHDALHHTVGITGVRHLKRVLVGAEYSTGKLVQIQK